MTDRACGSCDHYHPGSGGYGLDWDGGWCSKITTHSEPPAAGAWIALMQAAAIITPSRAELDGVTPEALAVVVANPGLVNAEFRSRHTGELL